jgi:hypothetical protein
MSKIEVDAIDKQSGSTLTLGGSGTAVTLACGATQTGFGRTGTVDWQTGSIKTATFTAANGEGYFCNTAGGTFEVDLPAGSAGAIVSIQDYNNTFDSNNLTVDPDGSEKINGGDAGETVTLSTEGQGVTFVYIDATVGWRTVAGSDDPFATPGITPAFICASVSGSGNTLTTVNTNFKVAKFTGPGTFTVNSAGNAAGSNTVSYMVVAGGGGGGVANSTNGNYASGAGGGAGGFREGKSTFCTHTASPLATTGLPVSAQGYAVVIGGGGPNSPGTNLNAGSGTVSSFSTITSAGGGGGAGKCSPAPGLSGGSGGGGGYGPGNSDGGSGNSPAVSPPQGQSGGDGNVPGCYATKGANGGGGGGATAVGANTIITDGGDGGAGATTNIGPGPEVFAGGGGGGSYKCGGCQGLNGSGAGGTGGGGPGGPAAGSTATGNGQNGTANTGGGAGGGSTGSNGGSGPTNGGTGGAGIVYIRYKFQ